jgi:hypothetical protein
MLSDFSPEFQSQIVDRLRSQQESAQAAAMLAAAERRRAGYKAQPEPDAPPRMPELWRPTPQELQESIRTARRTFLTDAWKVASLLRQKNIPTNTEVAYQGGRISGWSLSRLGAYYQLESGNSSTAGTEELLLEDNGQLLRLRHKQYEPFSPAAHAPIRRILGSTVLDGTRELTETQFDYPFGQAQQHVADAVIRYNLLES